MLSRRNPCTGIRSRRRARPRASGFRCQPRRAFWGINKQEPVPSFVRDSGAVSRGRSSECQKAGRNATAAGNCARPSRPSWALRRSSVNLGQTILKRWGCVRAATPCPPGSMPCPRNPCSPWPRSLRRCLPALRLRQDLRQHEFDPGRADALDDYYHYYYDPRGYYPYYNSGEWGPRRVNRFRGNLPPYYGAWGANKRNYRHVEWHRRHYGGHRRGDW